MRTFFDKLHDTQRIMKHPVKYQDESWHECAQRLGTNARFEGKPIHSNPFEPGWLSRVWTQSWVTADDEFKEHYKAAAR